MWADILTIIDYGFFSLLTIQKHMVYHAYIDKAACIVQCTSQIFSNKKLSEKVGDKEVLSIKLRKDRHGGNKNSKKEIIQVYFRYYRSQIGRKGCYINEGSLSLIWFVYLRFRWNEAVQKFRSKLVTIPVINWLFKNANILSPIPSVFWNESAWNSFFVVGRIGWYLCRW